MTLSSTGAKQGPALDEKSFQQLLAAAYIVQQHNQNPARKGSPLDTGRILSEIAEIQSLIRAGDMDVPTACHLVAERLFKMTQATGVTMSLITNGYLDCVAESGVAVKIPGRCISSHSLVATEKLKAGGTFESTNALEDLCLEVGLCEKLGVGSLVAAPIERFGELAGLIEIRWDRDRSSVEGDLRACRLMAGLASGMLERNARLQQKQAPETPTTAPVQLESAPLQTPPDVEPTKVITDETCSELLTTAASLEPSAPEPKLEPLEAEDPAVCRVCGNPFRGDESFCGHCSLPRLAASPAEGLQSKWASLWYMQQAKGTLQEAPAPLPVDEPTAEVEPIPVVDRLLEIANRGESNPPAPARTDLELLYQPEPDRFAWLRSVAKIKVRVRDVVLVTVALVLAGGVASAWPKSDSQLTWFQMLAIRYGLVHPSNAPNVIYQGDPDVRVWVDVHTALYYCDGADLYGKTPDGQFMTQHDAQSTRAVSASQSSCP